VSHNEKKVSQNLYQSHPFYASISKYIATLKSTLKIDAEIALLETGGSRYELLKELAQNETSIVFEGSIYIPLKSKSSNWGFVKLKNSKSIGEETLEKAINTLTNLIPEESYLNGDEPVNSKTKIVGSIYGVDPFKAYSLAMDHFNSGSYTSFINLSEWLSEGHSFSLKDLREFKNSFLYIHEFMNLNKSQRVSLTLYSMLPAVLRKNALMLVSEKSELQLKKELVSEKYFLKVIKNKKIDIN
jgi:hypothetical protein